jgi:predicted nucleic-acid-binding protein
VVVLEIVYVLTKLYKIPRRGVLDILQSVQQIRGITILDTTDYKTAIALYRKHNVKFADCLIASQVPEDITIVTFDEELAKLRIDARQPVEIVAPD